MTAINIVEAEVAHQATWDAFVERSPSSTCFHRYAWRVPLESVLGYRATMLLAMDRDQAVGVLPVASVSSRLFGSSCVALPFCSYGGPVANDPEVAASLVQRAITIARHDDATYLEVRRIEPLDLSLPTESVYWTFRKALAPNIDDLRSVPQKRRNMVRKAITLGLVSRVGRDVSVFFELYAENARAHGTPALPKAFFTSLMDSLGDAADILTVENASGEPISTIMSFYHRNEVHAGFAGEVPAARSLAANDFKYWSLMKHAAGRGCTVFDFGRSKQGTGSFEFKRLWGFEPQQLHYQYPYLASDTLPQRNASNPKFQLAMKIWSRLPRVIVDRLGPLVIHGLG